MVDVRFNTLWTILSSKLELNDEFKEFFRESIEKAGYNVKKDNVSESLQTAFTCGFSQSQDNHGILELNNSNVLLKLDCKANSLLSVTQNNRKKEDHTMNFEEQIKMVKNKIIWIFHSHLLNSRRKIINESTILWNHGFHKIGHVILQENIHTKKSVNNSREYLSIFSPVEMLTEARQMYTKLNYFVQQNTIPHKLEDFSHLIDIIIKDDKLSNNNLTNHQKDLFEIYHHNWPNLETFYCNIGCSCDYADHVGPKENGSKRKPEGKIGAMSKVGFFHKNVLRGLTWDGVVYLRGINFFTNINQINIGEKIRNIVHPDYVSLIYQLCEHI